MSHTEKQDVTYYSGHVIESNGRRYAPERTCTMEYDTVHGDFVCSECGAWVRTDAASTTRGASLRYCPNCGAKVVDE